jgi:hypothetical protein
MNGNGIATATPGRQAIFPYAEGGRKGNGGFPPFRLRMMKIKTEKLVTAP